MTDKTEKNRKGIVLNNILMGKINAIQEREGHDTFKGTIISCINFKYSKMFPEYTGGVAKGSLRYPGNVTPQSAGEVAHQRAVMKDENKKAEQKLKEDVKGKVCREVLYGEVDTATDGGKVCKFQTHNMQGSFDQVMPLEQVSVILQSTLFAPSKEAVLTKFPKLKKKYEVSHDS